MKRNGRVAGLAVFAAVGMLGLPGPATNQAVAQMDWLTPHLQSQRHDNLRRHQQRLHQQRRQREGVLQQHQRSQPSASPGPDPARREQLMRRLEPEYHRRVQLYGKASADDWLKRTAWQFGVEEGRRARARQRAKDQ